MLDCWAAKASSRPSFLQLTYMIAFQLALWNVPEIMVLRNVATNKIALVYDGMLRICICACLHPLRALHGLGAP